jgi:hypothetical protein
VLGLFPAQTTTPAQDVVLGGRCRLWRLLDACVLK